MKNCQENESHMSMLLTNERKIVDSKGRSLAKCEAMLKQCSDKNEEINRENATLTETVITLKSKIIEFVHQTFSGFSFLFRFQLNAIRNDLKESRDREDSLNQDVHSLSKLLQETQDNLRDFKEKVHQLSVSNQSHY